MDQALIVGLLLGLLKWHLVFSNRITSEVERVSHATHFIVGVDNPGATDVVSPHPCCV